MLENIDLHHACEIEVDGGSARFQACRNIQDMLAGLGIPSALYSLDGRFLRVSPHVSLDAACQSCLTEPSGQWLDALADQRFHAISCPVQGCSVVAVPLFTRSEDGVFLVCCLRELSCQKTEELERLCSRFSIDSTLLHSLAFKGVLSASPTQLVMSGLIETLAEKTHRQISGQHDLEAITQSLSQSYEELTLLHRVSDGMRVTQQPEDFFRTLCNDLQAVMGTEQTLVLWTNKEKPDLEYQMVAAQGKYELSKSDLDLLWARSLGNRINKKQTVVENNPDDPGWPMQVCSVLAAPLRHGDKYMGELITFNRHDKEDFCSADMKMVVSMAAEMAVYLENYRLYQDMEDLLIGSLRALTSSIDAKDPYTCGHSERVAYVGRWLGGKLGRDENQLHDLYLTGLLHDVGKIGVSENILCKPGRLTTEEFEHVKRHPGVGANILGGIKQMAHVIEGVVSHHERFDGNGYPRGLQGRNIPHSGLIVMLADSFDAMTSHRTYRKALPLTSVISEIRRASGTQFAPDVAEAFLDNDIRELAEQLAQIGHDKQIADVYERDEP